MQAPAEFAGDPKGLCRFDVLVIKLYAKGDRSNVLHLETVQYVI